jgi:cyclohexyl-isocyanide hydratase
MIMAPIRIGIVLFAGVTQLDVTGPYEILARMAEVETHLVAQTRASVRTQFGLALTPDVSFADAPQLDVVLVPGARELDVAFESDALLDFVRTQAARATYVTAVCTGSLVLGAAGLLRGYRATTHWLSMEMLASFGAIPVCERVVVDRNRMTAAGVTAGIDFGLRLAAQLRGPRVAQEIQLAIEYEPAPPFRAGSPRTAPPALVDALAEKRGCLQAQRRSLVERAALRLVEEEELADAEATGNRTSAIIEKTPQPGGTRCSSA